MDNQIVLVTGGATGIGAAISERFAREGSRVIIADLQEQAGEEMAARLGDHTLFLKTDVSNETFFGSVIESTIRRFGHIDTLINNAGIPGPSGGIADISLEDFDFAIAVLLRSVFIGMKCVAPSMKERQAGTIINMSSVAGFMVGNGLHVYSAAKAAIIHLTRSVSLELAEFGIRVNCICPGAIATPLYGKTAGLNDEASERSLLAVRELLKDMQPLQFAGLPADIADAVLWLSGKESRFVTGQIIVIDGGLSLGQKWKQAIERRKRISDYLYGALDSL